jgi:hypothetical protein
MRQYKMIAHIILILPIINFAFALPMATQETCQACGDVKPDVATTMSAKRGDDPWIIFEYLAAKAKAKEGQAGPKGVQPEAPDHGSMDPPQMGTSEIQQVSPELSKSPSEVSMPESEASKASAHDYPVSTNSESGAAMENPESNSFLREMANQLKFWRRTSSPVSVRDAVNAAQRQLQDLVDTGAYVSASSPESQTF